VVRAKVLVYGRVGSKREYRNREQKREGPGQGKNIENRGNAPTIVSSVHVWIK